MFLRSAFASVVILNALASAQVCQPIVSAPTIVASPAQRLAAAQKAQPPIDDTSSGFAWPDTPLGVIKVGGNYEFFASDGGAHYRQLWDGREVGNNKSGSITTSVGTLDAPLGTGDPEDVTISPNPNVALNPNYSSYGYMGGGPVYRVPEGGIGGNLTGAGNLLAVYHGELPNDPLYAVLGLAASPDNGKTWTDLGEIVRLNQAYLPGLDGFEIGDGRLVLSPDKKYFYLYFPDWMPNGTPHATRTTRVSVARAPVSAVLQAAFGSPNQSAAHFQKYYAGGWDLQPGISGVSTDLIPNSPYQGYIDVHYNPAIQRYAMIISDDTTFAYAESVDGLVWTVPVSIGTFGPIAAYPTAVGLGDDPQVLGKTYYLYFTYLPTDGTGWENGALHRLTITCK